MNGYEWPTKLTKKKDGKHFMEEEEKHVQSMEILAAKLPGNCSSTNMTHTIVLDQTGHFLTLSFILLYIQ